MTNIINGWYKEYYATFLGKQIFKYSSENLLHLNYVFMLIVLFFKIISVLLGYHSHTLRFTLLRCTIH